MKFDDAGWHTESARSEAHAAAHIGAYFRWCVEADLVSEDEHGGDPDLVQQLAEVRGGTRSGTEYVWENMSGVFCDHDLTEEGARFTSEYFGKEYLDVFRDLAGGEDYTLTENELDFPALRARIDAAFERWRATPKKPKRPWWKVWA